MSRIHRINLKLSMQIALVLINVLKFFADNVLNSEPAHVNKVAQSLRKFELLINVKIFLQCFETTSLLFFYCLLIINWILSEKEFFCDKFATWSAAVFFAPSN